MGNQHPRPISPHHTLPHQTRTRLHHTPLLSHHPTLQTTHTLLALGPAKHAAMLESFLQRDGGAGIKVQAENGDWEVVDKNTIETEIETEVAEKDVREWDLLEEEIAEVKAEIKEADEPEAKMLEVIKEEERMMKEHRERREMGGGGQGAEDVGMIVDPPAWEQVEEQCRQRRSTSAMGGVGMGMGDGQPASDNEPRFDGFIPTCSDW
ncbi:hypothetical protein BCR34DRAFT_603436 [Clohesyomyces aquaticus]|uniref:Uncharacterized protein n=1 Tax=Clohesyomyces aquaticus TaxID=1231657 RepID=A0A1Y1ZED8_9PLEO|nr:hypothetical protein BCR34DRAFT_603436 [Clohesyomyces aquaticus]